MGLELFKEVLLTKHKSWVAFPNPEHDAMHRTTNYEISLLKFSKVFWFLLVAFNEAANQSLI
jgi:hypothetical protein